MPTQAVVKELVELFKVVADECDGTGGSIRPIRQEYERLMRIAAVLDFYGDLVDARHAELRGEETQ